MKIGIVETLFFININDTFIKGDVNGNDTRKKKGNINQI
jgi:hypothetical protein